jgi:hypothetical protein
VSRVTKIISPDGRVTTIKQTSGCGCLTVLAFLVVIFGPAAWFGPTGAALAYSGLGLVVVALCAIAVSRSRSQRKAPLAWTPQPPPARPGDPSPVMRTPDGQWISYDGGEHFTRPSTSSPPPPPTQ